MNSAELKSTLGRLAAAAGAGKARRLSGREEQGKLDLNPACTFGALVEQRLKDLDRDLGELKARLNGLIFLVLGAVVVDIVMRLMK